MPDVQTPDWVKDAVFYQIFPDRFAKSDTLPKPSNLQPWGAPPTNHGYQGGDLIGVVEHLDCLVDLGINAIYFNPVFASGSNHRYHTYDYYHVDPLLGGNAALRKLVDAAHARGIRVILDGVFNHASRGFFSSTTSWRMGRIRPTWTGLRSSVGRSVRTAARTPTTRPGGICRRCRSLTSARRPCASSLGMWPSIGSSSGSTAGAWMCPARSMTMRFGRSFAAG